MQTGHGANIAQLCPEALMVLEAPSRQDPALTLPTLCPEALCREDTALALPMLGTQNPHSALPTCWF
jgi:hypothetical protein